MKITNMAILLIALAFAGCTNGTAADNEPSVRHAAGVIVSEVTAEGLAARAGVLPGDLIIAYDDKIVENGNDLRALVDTRKVAEGMSMSRYEMRILILRNGAIIAKTVGTGELGVKIK